MDFIQYFAQGWKNSTNSGPPSGCFDCNICLDFAHEPVVTLCGHLYCWPCIYKWLHVQSASLDSDEHPQCPLCKSEISHKEMVPLYGKGLPSPEELQGKSTLRGTLIPPRPTVRRTRTLNSSSSSSSPQTGQQQLPYRNPYRTNHHYNHLSYDDDSLSGAASSLSPLVSFGFHHWMGGMFGDMFYASVFGNSEGLYRYPNNMDHFVRGSSGLRSRRQEMQADRSLNRISIFLFCCYLLCRISIFLFCCYLLCLVVF